MRSVFQSKFPCPRNTRPMCLNTDLPSWRLVLELFLREDVSHCKAFLLRAFLGFHLRLVRLVLDSVFRSTPGPSGQFQIGAFVTISMFVSILIVGFPCHLLYQGRARRESLADWIHSTSSLPGRGFDTCHLCSHCGH